EASGVLPRNASPAAPEEAHASGRLRCERLDLAGTEGFVEVRGLDLDLPVDLAWSSPLPEKGAAFRGAPLSGRVRFDRLAVGGLDVPATATALAVSGDTVGLQTVLNVPVLGGRVSLERIRLAELLSVRRRMEGGVVLSDIQMDRAASAFGLPAL